jgi:hypothetical protein
VPAGTARLRLAAMASHTPSELRTAASVLGAAARDLGLEASALAPPRPTRRLAAEERDPERDGELEPARAAVAAIAGTPSAPFDLEREGGELAGRRPAAETGSNAPFDLERETVRAA